MSDTTGTKDARMEVDRLERGIVEIARSMGAEDRNIISHQTDVVLEKYINSLRKLINA